MRRRVVVLAAAALAPGLAQAQSSVILYGVIDANIEYVSNMSATKPTVNPTTGAVQSGPAHSLFRMNTGGYSTNRWGMRGTEELGGGLSANFVLEGGFTADDGKLSQGGRLFGRQAYVGLTSKEAGQITFGRQYNSLFMTLGNYSPTSYAVQYEPVFVMTGQDYREDNMVKYTGTFGPLSMQAHWSFGTGVADAGEVPGQFRRDSGYGAGLSYAFGPASVAVAFDEYDPTLTASGASGYGRFRKIAVAANYSAGPLALMGGYRWGRNVYSDGAALLRDNFYWIGGTWQFTPRWSTTLAFYYDDLKGIRLTRSSPELSPANPWQALLLVDYAFSKRTDVYFSTAYAKNAGLNLDTSAVGFMNGYFLGQGKNSMVGAAFGIRHKF